MSDATASFPPRGHDALYGVLRAGILTSVIDGLFSSVLSVFFYNSTAQRLFQGVAATVVGVDAAFNGGAKTYALGVLMHIGVAFGWSIVYLLIVKRLSWVRNLLKSNYGIIKVAALYGPFIWMVMSLVVIPVLLHRPPAINKRWLIQLIGHFPFVGIPIVASFCPGLFRYKRQ